MRRTSRLILRAALILSIFLLGSASGMADTSTTALPDLIISSVIYTPANPTQGQWVKAQVVVKNQGSGRAVFRVGQTILNVKPVGFGDTVAATEDFIIPPGGSQSYNLTTINPYNNRAPGTYSLIYTVNPGTVLSETNGGNNSATYPLTLAASQTPISVPTYDLAIESIRVDPPRGTTATNFTFTVLIKNRGNTKARVDNVVYELPKGQSTSFRNNNPNVGFWLDPGQTREFKGQPYDVAKRTSTLPGGLLNIAVTVNPYDKEDANLGDNTRTCQVEVVDPAIGSVGRPTLKLIQSWAVPGKTVKMGENITVVGQVSNCGDGDALVPNGVTLMNVTEGGKILAAGGVKGNWYPDSDVVIPANCNLITPISVPIGPLTPGTHNLLLTVDPQNIIQEKDETHHQAVVQVTVIGPDLGMSAVLQLSQAPLSTRDTLRVDVTVKNQGPMKAFFPQGSYFIYYGAQGFTMNKLILPNSLDLAAGQEYRTTLLVLPFTPNAGAYTMVVSLDPTNSMGDPNQANNRVALPFSLANPRITDAKPVTPAGPSVVTKPAPTGTRSGVVPPKTSTPPVKTPDLVR